MYDVDRGYLLLLGLHVAKNKENNLWGKHLLSQLKDNKPEDETCISDRLNLSSKTTVSPKPVFSSYIMNL